ncbi:MAG: PcfJ domain-containing protein [Lachnospiraceae bacterium]|nr:PcfJ domain-containing protein [Lachnospiraceae bacterium]
MGAKAIYSALELFSGGNTWEPPAMAEDELAGLVRENAGSDRSSYYLHIFRTEPYIDSVCAYLDVDGAPSDIRRFTFHEGYSWSAEEENFFHDTCVRTTVCRYEGERLNRIFTIYDRAHPEWHLKRYFSKGLRILDHIYSCLKENTAKEMLYKSGLDELAAGIGELDEINLLATKPSDLYDGLSMKVLRSINCPAGAQLIKDSASREYIRDLNMKFPDTFKERLNDAQCRYLRRLIDGGLIAGETGRLFAARRAELARVWCPSQFELFLECEKSEQRIRKLCEAFEKIDSIYVDFIKSREYFESTSRLDQLEYYLLKRREEYDRAIRRSNRKRCYEWQERGSEYIIRYPQTINDFCRESIYMRNCLLTYVEAIVNNNTTILLMRRAEEPDKPFITIEIFEDDLVQAYHRFNRDCTSEEAEWIRAYCKRHGIGTCRFSFNAAVDELF